MTHSAPAWYSLFPFAACAVLLAWSAFRSSATWRREHRLHAGDLLVSLPHLLLSILLGVFSAMGLVEESVGWAHMAIVSAVLACGGVLVHVREPLQRVLSELPRPVSISIRAGIALVSSVVIAVVCAWAIDFTWLDDSGAIAVEYFATSAAIFFALCLALYFLGQRTGIAMMLVPFLAAGFGIAQHFVVDFKGSPIMPMDLLALGTAGAVAGGYDYLLTGRMVTVIGAVAACVVLALFIVPERAADRRRRMIGVAANTSVGLALTAALCGSFWTVKLEETLQFTYDRWMPLTTYETLGFVPAFIEIAQDVSIPVPEGYDESDAEELVEDLAAQFDAGPGAAPERQLAEAQFNEVRPTVIAVMNETFTDLSIYDSLLGAGYTGPQYYKNLAGTLQLGPLMVPVMGGGTANSEFEFLTGNAMAFIGGEKYPYQLYELSQSSSLARQFKELGYATTALHPQDRSNWNRSSAYRQLGFDTFLSGEVFEDAPVYHAGASDASTYDKILDLLAADQDPQFIFDVTMQNHGGYTAGSVPAEDMVHLDIPGVEDEGFLTELGVYLACIQRSDEDLAYFIERLSALDRPVVLVFFGDHQPGLSATLADLFGQGSDEVARSFKICESTYIVWSNYELVGFVPGDVREVGSSQLGVQVLYRIGAPLTPRQKADYMLGEQITSINNVGYRGADGLRYAIEAESPYSQVLHQMQNVQYLDFGSRV